MENIFSLVVVVIAIIVAPTSNNLLFNALISKSSLEDRKPFKVHKGEPDKKK